MGEAGYGGGGGGEWTGGADSVSVLTTATVYVPPGHQQPHHHPSHPNAYSQSPYHPDSAQGKRRMYGNGAAMLGYGKGVGAGKEYPQAGPSLYPNPGKAPFNAAQQHAMKAVAVATATATAVAFNGTHPDNYAQYQHHYQAYPSAAAPRPYHPHYPHQQGSSQPPLQQHPLTPQQQQQQHQQQFIRPRLQATQTPAYAPPPSPRGLQAPPQYPAASAAPTRSMTPSFRQAPRPPPLPHFNPAQAADVKPVLGQVDERMSFPARGAPPLLRPFRLDHNMELTNIQFKMNEDWYTQLMNNPSLDLQLKCFHHDDRSQANSWPTAQQQPNSSNPYHNSHPPPVSVEVAINGVRVPIEKPMQPLYVKQMAQPNDNTLSIRVFQCCCSHYFVLQLVRRVGLDDILKAVKGQSAGREGALARLRSLIAQPATLDGSIERTSETLSLKCPISQQLLSTPARARHCTHLRCFDLRTFLCLNKEKAQYWQCPICGKHVTSTEELETDTFITDILYQAPKDTEAVTIEANGTWRPVTSAPSPDLLDTAPPIKRTKSEIKTEPDPTYRMPLWSSHSVPATSQQQPPLPHQQQIQLQPQTQPQTQTALMHSGGQQTHYNSPGQPSSGYLSSGSGVMSPHYHPYPSPQASKGPATPGRYGPATPAPATPQLSVRSPAGGPRSVPDPASTSLHQTGGPASLSAPASDAPSTAGSAPYTPASVGSAGSMGSGAGPGQLSADLDGLQGLDLIPDTFRPNSQGDAGQLNFLSQDDLAAILNDPAPGDGATSAAPPALLHQQPPVPSANAFGLEDLGDFYGT